jgi:hypothetical protein
MPEPSLEAWWRGLGRYRIRALEAEARAAKAEAEVRQLRGEVEFWKGMVDQLNHVCALWTRRAQKAEAELAKVRGDAWSGEENEHA